MKVRRANEGDLPWLLTELTQFAEFADTKYSMLPPKESTRKEILKALMKEHVFLIAEKDGGGRTGFVAGLVVPHLLNPDILVFYETFWWVALEYRGSSAGLRLLDAVVVWAKEHIDWVFWSLQHNTPITDRVLTKRGFREQERQFLLEI